MPAPIKVNRALAALIIRDLPGVIAAAAASGIARPAAELKYADGLTRGEAGALYEWALKVPQLYAALCNTSHPEHRAVAAHQEVINYFRFDHPQNPDGTPANWSEPMSPAMRGYLLGNEPKIEGELDPAEAASFAAYAGTRSDVMAALHDPNAPGHAAVAQEMEQFQTRAAEASPANAATQDQEGKPMPLDDATQARIDALNKTLGDENVRGEARESARNELAELLSKVPAGTPIAPSDTTGARALETRPAPAKTGTERAVELTERLRDTNPKTQLLGTDRNAALAQLESALTAPAAAQSGEGAGA